ncbi:ABC transporter permease [Eubacteriales bacterium OttesenSCG-928-A19]|nr:ABC transporter permease [Eubacteriales bacterium OttesenSCG-928-A19]
MLKYFFKRLFFALISLFLVLTIVFLLMRLMPVEGYFADRSDSMNEATKEAVLRNLGLLDPVPVQLLNFYKDLLHGDLGNSIVYRPRVSNAQILGEKIPYSASFGLASVVISLTLGCGLGILMARSKGKFWDKLGTGYILIINAVPAIVVYLFLQVTISGATGLPILFSAGKPSSYILPLLCMSLGGIASNALWIRRYMVDELNKDYIKLAKAKGVKNSQIMLRHVVRNAFIPMAQYLPSSILMTVTGSIYVEALFSIPGLGGLLVTAIQRQDNTLVQALVLLYASIGVVGLLLGDFAMALCDPRINLSKEGGSR